MQFNQTKYALAAVCVAAIAACGGGGGGSAGNAGGDGSVTTLSGAVIDGYISGATVFLDLNNNQTLDSGEPSTTSTADGKYTLTLTGVTTAQARSAHIVTVVPTNAKDSDDNGQTLAQAGKSAFTMLAPVQAYVAADGTVSSAVVSPITTLLSHDMLTDGSKSLATATSDVQTRLGIAADTSLLQDPTQNVDLKTKAKVIAAAIGQVKTTVKNSALGTSDRDALFAALIYLQQNIAALQQAVATLQAANNTLSVNEAVNNAVTNIGGSTSALVPAPTTLLTSAQQTTSSTQTDFATALAGGFYSGNCLLDDGSDSCANQSNVNYTKTFGTSTAWTQVNYGFFSDPPAQWYAKSENGVSAWVLSPTAGWVAKASAGSSGTWVADGLGVISTDAATGEQQRYTLRVQDVANKSYGSVAGVNPPTAFASNVFPEGAKVYFFSSSPITDVYRLFPNFVPGTYSCTGGACTSNSYTSLAELINAKQTPAANAVGMVEVEGSNGLNFTFNEDAATALAATGGTIRLYSCSLGKAAAISNGCSGGNWVAGSSSSYDIRTVNGVQVLRINANYSGAQKLIYAGNGGTIFGGEYTPAHSWSTVRFNFNKIAMDALLTIGGRPAVIN